MNIPLPIRSKLVTAALSLSLVAAFAGLHGIGTRSSGLIALRAVCVVFDVVLAFWGVFGSAQLQLLWGWGLIVVSPVLLALCVFVFHGSDLVWGLFSMLAALVGGYLLVVDSGVRDYRENLRRRLGNRQNS